MRYFHVLISWMLSWGYTDVGLPLTMDTQWPWRHHTQWPWRHQRSDNGCKFYCFWAELWYINLDYGSYYAHSICECYSLGSHTMSYMECMSHRYQLYYTRFGVRLWKRRNVYYKLCSSTYDAIVDFNFTSQCCTCHVSSAIYVKFKRPWFIVNSCKI